jgi:hypothetical protein
MKKIIYSIIILCFSNSSFSQMNDGKYKFANNEITLSFTITDEGFQIKEINITNNTTKKILPGEGEWFKVNLNGVDADYNGPEGWYQIQTAECNYEFNVPSNKLTLSQYDCKKGLKEKKYQLLKK